jgi:hypothetical protein
MQNYTVDLVLNTPMDSSSPDSSEKYDYVIEGARGNRITVSKRFDDNETMSDIETFFERKAKMATLALIQRGRFIDTACPFFIVDWNSKRVEYLPSDEGTGYEDSHTEDFTDKMFPMNEQFDLNITRTVSRDIIDKYIEFSASDDNEVVQYLLECLCLGISSTNDRAKFLNFYAIVEYELHSPEFKDMFKEARRLFSDCESNKIQNIIDGCTEYKKRKMEALSRIMKYTLNKQGEELYDYLKARQIACTLNADELQKLIDHRNNITHQGEVVNVIILYEQLMPLVTAIVVKRLGI